MWRTIARYVSLALLVFSGVAGINNGMNDVSAADTPLRAVVTTGVFSYGLFGLVGAAAILRRWKTAPWLVGAWGAAVTIVATLAPIAWGGPDVPLIGALAGGLATALIGAGVWWASRIPTRELDPR